MLLSNPADPILITSIFYHSARLSRLNLFYVTIPLQDPQPSFTFPSIRPHSFLLSFSPSLSVTLSLLLLIPLPHIFSGMENKQDAQLLEETIWNLGRKNTGCHTSGPGHLPLRGVKGRADYEGEAGGAEGPAWRREDRGAGKEGGGLLRGSGSPEPQDRGEDAG